MLLYHGTSERHLSSILASGLRPRGRADGNWDANHVPSNPECVYLTDTYAPFFALNAAEDGERWAIIEVDSDRLNERNMRPDEDFLEQATRGIEWREELLSGCSLAEATAAFRCVLHRYADMWRLSAEKMGTCAHHGAVPPEAVTRVALFDPRSNPYLAMAWSDPAISILNHMCCSSKYKALTRWMFEPVERVLLFDVDPIAAAVLGEGAALLAIPPQVLAERSGLEVIPCR